MSHAPVNGMSMSKARVDQPRCRPRSTSQSRIDQRERDQQPLGLAHDAQSPRRTSCDEPRQHVREARRAARASACAPATRARRDGRPGRTSRPATTQRHWRHDQAAERDWPQHCRVARFEARIEEQQERREQHQHGHQSRMRSTMIVANAAGGAQPFLARQQVRPQHLAGPRRQHGGGRKANHRRPEHVAEARRAERPQQILPALGAHHVGQQRRCRAPATSRSSSRRARSRAQTCAKSALRRKTASRPTGSSAMTMIVRRCCAHACQNRAVRPLHERLSRRSADHCVRFGDASAAADVIAAPLAETSCRAPRPFSTPTAPACPLVAAARSATSTPSAITLLIVATDRISAFDYVLGSGIPDKGKVLTQLSAFWFDSSRGIVPNHVISTDVATTRRRRRHTPPMLARPIDAGAQDDAAAGRVRRARLPVGLGLEGLPGDRRGLRHPLPRACASPIGCPSRSSRRPPRRHRARREHHGGRRGQASSATRRWSSALDADARALRRGVAHAESRGIILADTKFEFGLTGRAASCC